MNQSLQWNVYPEYFSISRKKLWVTRDGEAKKPIAKIIVALKLHAQCSNSTRRRHGTTHNAIQVMLHHLADAQVVVTHLLQWGTPAAASQVSHLYGAQGETDGQLSARIQLADPMKGSDGFNLDVPGPFYWDLCVHYGV